MTTGIRDIPAGVLFVVGICPLLLLNVVPFNNAIACLTFWGIAFVLLLPDERQGRSIPLRLILVAMLLVGASLRYRLGAAEARGWLISVLVALHVAAAVVLALYGRAIRHALR